jgi:hypothetical protein
VISWFQTSRFKWVSLCRYVEACDARIAASIKKIAEHARRRTFFLGFSHSPVDFINTIVVGLYKLNPDYP